MKRSRFARPSARALLVIDNAPIRRETMRAYRTALGELERIQAQWSVFNDQDQPAFRRWYETHFSGLLRLIEESSVEIYRKQALIEAVMQEAAANGIGLSEAYENVVNGNASSEPETPETDDEQEEYEEQEESSSREYFERENLEEKPDDEPRPEPSQRSIKIRDLYRRLALKLHPDVSGSKTKELLALWLQVQDARDSGDLEKLERIWGSLHAGQRPDLAAETIGEIRERIEALVRSIRSMRKRVRNAKRDRAWGFSRGEGRRRARAVRKSIQRELSEELAELREVIRAMDRIIEDWSDDRIAG